MDILAFLRDIVDPIQLQVLGYLVVGNLVLGAFAALKKGEFQFSRFKDFWTRVACYGAGYLVVSSFVKVAVNDATGTIQPIAALQPAIWLGILVSLVKDISDNLKDMGLPIPDVTGWLNKTTSKVLGG